MSTTWAGRDIDYLLTLEPRRDLVITVHPDKRVTVLAPDARPIELVRERIEARRPWIVRQLREFETIPAMPAPQFVSGESFQYLGRQCRLRVERGTGGASLHAGRLWVRVRTPNSKAAVRRAVLAWYAVRSREVFEKRIERLKLELPLIANTAGQLRIRRMNRRWGSCTSNGTITLNPVLVQATHSCIDYVIVHEFLHRLEPGHTPRFYRLLSRTMSNWRERQRKLSALPVRFL